ncbi:MAG: hypothetical protein JSW16_00215 [Dehalococcoidales bacterium]|nr:MAG: hypothetical protein JSW16_00215 [Dehalococcoidales bacterium]
MRKRWVIITTCILSLLVLASAATPALAQEGEDSTDNQPAVCRALAIDAPRKAEVGEKVTITVTERGTGDAVKDAGVWALTRENAELLKAEIEGIRQSADVASVQSALEHSVNIRGIFLGTTNGSGKVKYAFEQAGGYLLVALKPGYFPAWKPIFIVSVPKALAIDAPRKAAVGEKVTITVTERGTGDAVKDAGVWALTRENAELLKAEIEGIRQSADIASVQSALEQSVNIRGIFLGTTNGSGKVKYAFEQAGGYLLVALKPGYFPAWKPIVIVNIPKALAIDAPRKAAVGEKVTITVTERGTGDAVKDAGVWALTRENAELLKAEIEGIRQSADVASVQSALEESVNIRGIFLGTTNGSGKVKHAFEQANVYLLVALKPGYFPAWKPIFIVNVDSTVTSLN